VKAAFEALEDFRSRPPGMLRLTVAPAAAEFVLHGSVVWRRGVDGIGGEPVPDPGQSPCHSKRTKIAVITSRSSGTE